MSTSEKGVPLGTEITIPAMDDWHLHLRGEDEMGDVVGYSARWARRALIMPNRPLITTVDQASAYRDRILAALPEYAKFEPLMTLCLTDNTTPEEVRKANRSGIIYALKAYVADLQNNPDTGITRFFGKVRAAITTAQEVGMPVSIHGEVSDPNVDVFDRERFFIDRVLYELVAEFPDLRITLEHLSTAYAVRFVEKQSGNVFGTIAPHYLVANRNDMLANGICPDFYCSPILKTAADQWTLIHAAASGDSHFGPGTDSAPWGRRNKYAARGKGGCFDAPAAPGLYAEAFDSIGKIEMLGEFVSHGPKQYGLSPNTGTMTLVREDWIVPRLYPFGDDVVTPFRAGQVVKWKIKEVRK